MKNLFFFLPIFIWLQACSESPAPASTRVLGETGTILADSAFVMGDSPDNKFRLFRSVRKGIKDVKADIVLLQMQEMKQTLVALLPAQVNGERYKPKSFWSLDSKYLMIDNDLTEGDNPREVLLYDLPTLEIAHRQPGELLAFDKANNIVFYYRSTSDRQSVCYFSLSNPKQEYVRDVIAPPGDKLPIVTLVTETKEARVKAYKSGGAPVNFAIKY